MCKGNILIQILMEHILCLRKVIDIIPCLTDDFALGVDIFIGERRLIQSKRAALQTDGGQFQKLIIAEGGLHHGGELPHIGGVFQRVNLLRLFKEGRKNLISGGRYAYIIINLADTGIG